MRAESLTEVPVLGRLLTTGVAKRSGPAVPEEVLAAQQHLADADADADGDGDGTSNGAGTANGNGAATGTSQDETPTAVPRP
jgi:hypothetical protein